jgi:hypothetical protein
MKEVLNTLLMVLIVIGALLIAFLISGKKMKKSCDFILQDLRMQKAVDPASAVALPYCRKQLLQLGFRDYRPPALDQLLKYGLVRMTEEGTFFLGKSEPPAGSDPSAQANGTEPVRPS